MGRAVVCELCGCCFERNSVLVSLDGVNGGSGVSETATCSRCPVVRSRSRISKTETCRVEGAS